MAASAAEIRERLGHPVSDCDAHVIEYLPLVRVFVVEESGEEAARGLDAAIQGTATVGRLPPAARRPLGAMRPPWWALAASSLRSSNSDYWPTRLSSGSDLRRWSQRRAVASARQGSQRPSV
jgi:hypothetical protein